MAEPITHLAHADWPGATACGLGFTGMSNHPHGPVVTDPAAVTCARCRSKLEAARGDTVPQRVFPASNVRIMRLYQARCPCGWSSEIAAYPDRHLVEADKRAHVAEHRRQKNPDDT